MKNGFVISIPDQFSPQIILTLSCMVCIFQLLCGTTFYFCSCVLVFNVLLGFTINSFGGPGSVNGVLILIWAFKTLVISQILKILYWQAAHTNLDMPDLTITAFLLGIIGFFISSKIVKTFSRDLQILPPIMDAKLLYRIALATLLISTFGYKSTLNNSADNNTSIISGAISYLAWISPLAIIAACTRVLIKSNGTKIIDPIVLLVLFSQTSIGIFFASKQLMLTPLLSLGLSAIAFGFRIKLRHLLMVGFLAFFTQNVLAPFSDVGRSSFKQATYAERLSAMSDFFMAYLKDSESMTKLYSTYREFLDREEARYYLGSSQGIWDRFCLIRETDLLIRVTEYSEKEGFSFLTKAITFLPRSLTGEAETFSSGNYLGHKTNEINDDDMVTAISFGTIAESYAALGLWGCFFVPLIVFLPFFMVNALCVTRWVGNIWGLTFVLLLHHLVAEAGIGMPLFYVVRIFPFTIFMLFFIRHMAIGNSQNAYSTVKT